MSSVPSELNPFTDEDFRKWQAAERNLEELLKFMDKAEYCGVDCQDYRTMAQVLRERFARLRQTFFPEKIA